MKNPTSGDIAVMLNSIQAAQLPHVFIYHDWEVKTSGNPLTHGILRGGMGHDGRCVPNYGYDDLIQVADMYLERELVYPMIIVDTNHANSNKQFAEQPRIAWEVMASRQRSETLKNMIRGLMIESYLKEGTQPVPGKLYGCSITDPCLGWEASEKLILDLAETLE
jgi:3-deoxy-7-phosphoheptulonate synthase